MSYPLARKHCLETGIDLSLHGDVAQFPLIQKKTWHRLYCPEVRYQLILLYHRGDKQGEPKRVWKMLEDLDCPWDFYRVNKGVHAVNSDNVRVLYHIVQMV